MDAGNDVMERGRGGGGVYKRGRGGGVGGDVGKAGERVGGWVAMMWGVGSRGVGVGWVWVWGRVVGGVWEEGCESWIGREGVCVGMRGW